VGEEGKNVMVARHPRRWLAILVSAVSALLGALILCLLLFIAVLKGRDLPLPYWVEGRVASILSENLPDAEVKFSDLFLTLSENWAPQFQFENVSISLPGPLDAPLDVRSLRVEVNLPALFEGQIRPEMLIADGVFMPLSRQKTGDIYVQSADLKPSDVAMTLFPTLIMPMDQVLQTALFESLKTIAINNIAITYQDFLSRRNWVIDGARLVLKKQGAALSLDVSMGLLAGGADYASLRAGIERQIGESAANFDVVFEDFPAQDMASQLPFFAWLNPVEGPISGAINGAIDGSGALGALSVSLQIKQGAVRPNETAVPIQFETAQTYFTYDPLDRRLEFDQIKIVGSDVSFLGQGYAALEMNEAWPDSLFGQLRFSEARANFQNSQLDAVILDDALVDFRLNLTPFRLDIGQFYATNSAKKISVRGQARVNAEALGWSVALDARTPTLTKAAIMEYWPVGFKPRSRDWVSKNVKHSKLRDVRFAWRLPANQPPVLDLGFAYEETALRVTKSLPMITQARGQFSSNSNRLATNLSAGFMTASGARPVDMSGTRFVIPDTKKIPSDGVADVVVSGQLADVLPLVDIIVSSRNSETKLPKIPGVGEVALTASVSFSMVKNGGDSVEIFAEGDVKNFEGGFGDTGAVISSDLVQIVLSPEQLELTGTGRFDQVPFTAKFQKGLGPDQADVPALLEAELDLSSELVNRFTGAEIEGLISGSSPAQVTASLPSGAEASFSLSSDLVGLGVNAKQINWQKPAEKPAQFRLTGRYNKRVLTDAFSLTGAGLNLEGAVDYAEQEEFKSLSISKLQVDDILDVFGQFNPAMGIEVFGGWLNFPKLMEGMPETNAAQTAPLALKVALDEVVLGENKLTEFRADLISVPQLSGPFSAKVNGVAQVEAVLSPLNGRTALEVTSEQAGRLLTSVGALQSATGGQLRLNLTPTQQMGETDGLLEIRNVKVQKAPVFAELLNAISIVGLLEQLTGPGILLSEVDAKFRSTEEQIIVESASAFGPSIGLSLDGYYNRKAESLDMQGVLSPIYFINGIGSALTRKGDGLFGFSFKLDGKKGQPSLEVNPLSILTPGIFRDVFRRPPPKLE
jgi:hypothetical protein